MYPLAIRSFRAAMLASGLIAAFSTPAHAQFGKLKKMGADAIKDAAKSKTGDKKEDAKKTVLPAAKAENVPVLTADHVAIVVASLVPYTKRAHLELDLKAAIARVKAGDAAHDARKDAFSACIDKAQAQLEKEGNDPTKLAARAQGSETKRKSYEQQSKAMTARRNAAVAAQDRRRVAFLDDSLMVVNQRTSLLMFAPNCVAEFTPAEVIEEQYLRAELAQYQGAFDPGAKAKGAMTLREFGLARERIAIWAMMQDEPLMKNSGPYGVFTAEEEAALKVNAADIAKLAPLFKANTLAWSQWSDLSDWNGRE